jgi:hypothetical protein
MVFNLKDVLKAIEVKEKPERKDTLIAVAEEHIIWTHDDKTKIIATLPMTKYQLHWLMWRIRVHLRSYEAFEWSEMKDVLTVILKQLEEEWDKCQSTAAPNVKENLVNGTPSTVDFVLTSPGL